MNKIKFIVTVVLAVGFLGYQQGWHKWLKSKDWQTVQSAPGHCSVELPGEPEVTTSFQRLNSTDSVKVTSYAVDFRNESYSFHVGEFSTFDLNKVNGEFNLQGAFEGAKNEALATSKGRLISEQDLTIGGRPAREFVIDSSQGMITTRVFNREKVMYSFVAIHPLGGNFDLDKSRLFDSFKFDEPLTADTETDL